MIGLEEAKLAGTNQGAKRLTVSIALATYNGERFLLEQLQSLSKQSVLPDELVVSDDGSTDRTLEILTCFARTAPFDVRILSNCERLGYRKNFLKTAEACRFEIIFFCDQDDIWDDQKISLIRDEFLDPETMMVYHHARLIDEIGNPIGIFYQPFAHNPWQTIFGMSMAFRRCLLVRLDLVSLSIDHNDPEFNLAHDQWVPLLASAFGRVAVVDEVLIGYRQHPGNLFGVSQTRLSFWERLTARIKDRADSFEQLVANCKANQKIFGELAREQALLEGWRERAQFAEKKFEKLGLLYDFRNKIYSSPSLALRCWSFFRLAQLGAYTRAGYWTFGPKSAIRDVIFGILLRPFVTKLGSKKVLMDVDRTQLF